MLPCTHDMSHIPLNPSTCLVALYQYRLDLPCTHHAYTASLHDTPVPAHADILNFGLHIRAGRTFPPLTERRLRLGSWPESSRRWVGAHGPKNKFRLCELCCVSVQCKRWSMGMLGSWSESSRREMQGHIDAEGLLCAWACVLVGLGRDFAGSQKGNSNNFMEG